jgi:hypothetical protein
VRQAVALNVLPIDRGLYTNLKRSAVVVVTHRPIVGPHTNADVKLLAYHVVLLAGSGDPLEARALTFGQQTMPIVPYEQEVINQTFLNSVREAVQKEYPSSELVDAQASVVYEDFPWTDEKVVQNLLNGATSAAVNSLSRKENPDFEFDLSSAKEAGLSAVVTCNLGDSSGTDFTNMPVRSDLNLMLSLTQQTSAPKGGYRDINSAEPQKNIASVSGFIDLSLAATDEYNAYAIQQNNQPKPKFVARLIETNVQVIGAKTTGTKLLAIASALLLAEDQLWFGYFKNKKTSGLRAKNYNFGAINIEGNLGGQPGQYGKPFDTESTNYTDLTHGQMMRNLVRPELYVGLDVSLNGADTADNEVFLVAAMQDHPQWTNAIAAILHSANAMTGGILGTMIDLNTVCPIQRAGQNVINERVLMGTYEDAEGVTRDIRDFDYLYMANQFGEKNPELLKEWHNNLHMTHLPQAFRQDALKKIIERAAPRNVKFHGEAQRVTFDAVFMRAFLVAMGRTMALNAKIGNLGGVYNEVTGHAAFASGHGLSGERSGAFNTNFGGFQGNAGGAPGYYRQPGSSNW